MAFELTIGYIDKKLDETSRHLAQSTTINVVLKEHTSIIDPVFILHGAHPGYPGQQTIYNDFMKYNYCYCTTLMRYYWIRDIKCREDGIFEFVCHCDVLATWKNSIENFSTFVKYCGNKKKRNGCLDDDRLQPERALAVAPYNFLTDVKDEKIWCKGTYGWVVNAEMWSLGDSTMITYLMDDANYKILLKGALNAQWSTTPGSVEEAIQLSLLYNGGMGSITSYIKSIYKVPCDFDQLKTNGTYMNVYIAGYKTDAMAYGFIDPLGTIGKTHTQQIDLNYIAPIDRAGGTIDEYEYFLRGDKYSTLVFKHPCGAVEIPLDSFIDNGKPTLVIRMGFSYLKGEYAFSFHNNRTNARLASCAGQLRWDYSSMIGGGNGIVDVAYRGLTKSLGAVAQNTLLKDTGVGTALGMLGDFNYSPIGHGIGPTQFNGSVASYDTCHYETIGGNDFTDRSFAFTLAIYSSIPNLIYTSKYDDYAKEQGYPCGDFAQLSSLMGDDDTYIQCAQAHLEGIDSTEPHPTANELIEINQFLNSGFFLSKDP